MSEEKVPVEAAAQLTEWLGEGWTARQLSGDASVRAYYRVESADAHHYVLAWYPAEVRAQVKAFMQAYRAVAPHAPVPLVVKHSDSAVLQVDVGDRTLFDVLGDSPQEGIALYRKAVDLLLGFQKSRAEVHPPFTAEFFRNELAMAQEYYIEKLEGREGGKVLERQLRQLADRVSQHPYVICHRDYHGQNLHIINNSAFIIDYQDLRPGPDTYDLASLLRDRGVADVLGEDLEMELVEHYAARRGADPVKIRQRYFETLMQRSIKILGTFARLPIARGKMHYLDFIPATLRSVARCSAELPEFASVGKFFPVEFSLDRARQRARELNESQPS